MSDFFVSPRFRASDLAGASIEKKIDAFEDQTRGWLLDHAGLVASNSGPAGQHAGFAILALCLIYVESIACFLQGETSDKKSREFFDVGLTAVFGDLDPVGLTAFSREFYRQVRCGLLHQGLTRGKVSITRGASVALAISLDGSKTLQQAIIDPWLFLAHVDAHFCRYVVRLRDPSETNLRAAFENWFDLRAA
jgi:hypothetical protein